MSDIVKCHVLGFASQTLNSDQSSSPGGAVWSGVRVRLSSGKTRFFPKMVVDAEASLIIQSAMDRGETVELWLSGNPDIACVYGVKYGADVHYTDLSYRILKGLSIKCLIIGIVTLPIFGLGIFGLISSIKYIYKAYEFEPGHSREYFLGHGDGGLLVEAA